MLFRKMFTVSAVSLTLLASSPVIALESSVEQTKPFTHEEIDPRFLGPVLKKVGEKVLDVGLGVAIEKGYEYLKEKFTKKEEKPQKTDREESKSR